MGLTLKRSDLKITDYSKPQLTEARDETRSPRERQEKPPRERVLVPSIYREDHYEHGHSSVFGSLFIGDNQTREEALANAAAGVGEKRPVLEKGGAWAYRCCGVTKKGERCPERKVEEGGRKKKQKKH